MVLIEKGTGKSPPKTRKERVVEVIHRTAVEDPYRWLEDPKNQEVKEWVDAQNNHTRRFLDAGRTRNVIYERIRDLYDREDADLAYSVDNPLPNGNYRSFQYIQKPGEEFKVLYYRDGERGRLRVAVDPNRFEGSPKVAMEEFWPNDDGTMMAYSTSERGSDRTAINVLDLKTGKTSIELENITFGTVVWAGSNDGFYYSRWPDPATNENPTRMAQVYFHWIGTKQESDEKVFGRGFGAERASYIDCSEDGKYLIFYKSNNVNTEVYYANQWGPEAERIRPLIKGMDAEFYVMDIVKKTAYVMTNLGASNYKLVGVKLDDPKRSSWKTIIPETEDVLEGVLIVGDKVVASYLDNIYSRIKVFSLDGKLMGEAKLPGKGHAAIVGSQEEYGTVEFSFESLISPKEHYSLDLETLNTERIGKKAESLIDFRKMEVEQVWYDSKDGTRIPMFLVHKKGLKLDGTNPVLLYGYGGFNLPSVSEFQYKIATFVDDGGVYAIANIRGGGEFGRDWYEGGRHKNQQNSIDDFIAAAEWLKERGYTTDRLAIRGRSNGGFLTAAAVVQRPELFKAVIVESPITDSIRATGLDIGPLCLLEFGDPRIAKEFEFIRKYSPYHNVKRREYPSVLTITGEVDTRCDPMHARKFAAHLQNSHVQNPEKPESNILLLTIKDVGHGGVTLNVPKSIQTEWTADWLTFVYKELDMVPKTKTQIALEQLQRAGE